MIAVSYSLQPEEVSCSGWVRSQRIDIQIGLVGRTVEEVVRIVGAVIRPDRMWLEAVHVELQWKVRSPT